ncbi:MAG: hypothetical protein HY675_24180 [Chloroflexi bacterium]|nr:hypothetical protein [Chloroflexota bacterium]
MNGKYEVLCPRAEADVSTGSPITDQNSLIAEVAEKASRIVFDGNLQEVHRVFYESGWTDGLPIVPPTKEAVAEMLAGTDLPADHVVARITPRLGKATVEKIAINAVMAGALPTYMPLLIAGVQALTDPGACFDTYEVGKGSWAPFWIVSGPVRKDLHVNSGAGALSPGDIANAAIGRAMGLIIRNIGGVRKGIEDISVFGNPGKYSMVIAENEEESPWEPLHVEQGFKGEDSTLSLIYPNTTTQIFPYTSDAEGILNAAIANIIPGRSGLICLVLIPLHAKALASSGWTKKDIAGFIAEYARVPAYCHPAYSATQDVSRSGVWQRPPNNPEDTMAILNSPDWIRIIVAGGPGAFMGLFQAGGCAIGNRWVTKKVELPANWDSLVEKCKGIVPNYLRY